MILLPPPELGKTTGGPVVVAEAGAVVAAEAGADGAAIHGCSISSSQSSSCIIIRGVSKTGATGASI